MKRQIRIGVCFGGYCPLHQGHLDLIMRAKKENDFCHIFVCGYDEEPRAKEMGITLKKKFDIIRRMFLGDEQIRIHVINDSEHGLDQSQSPENWKKYVDIIHNEIGVPNAYLALDKPKVTWYVAEESYYKELKSLHEHVVLAMKYNPISGTLIREAPLMYWDKIAQPFRGYFSKNILVTGTASEGKSTLVRDIATYFGMPYCEEYGRTYMAERNMVDTDLTVYDFENFLLGQRDDIVDKTFSIGNRGVMISDTDNLVTLMYAKAYSEDDNINVSPEDYQRLKAMAIDLQKDIRWDKIYLLPPKNEFVDDGTRYMAQSTMEERKKNYQVLVDLLKEFGLWNKVEMLTGDFYMNFLRIKSYVQENLNL